MHRSTPTKAFIEWTWTHGAPRLPARLTFIGWTAIGAGSVKGRARETEAVRPEVNETSSEGE